MNELGLQLLQPALRLLPLGDVVDEAGEVTTLVRAHFANRQFDRKCCAILALADDDAADADDAALAGPFVMIEKAIVIFAIGRWHQHLDVLADDLLGRIAEQPLRGAAERLDDATLVDHDHRVRDRIQDRL